MGQIKHYNNGKWTIYTSGEGLSGYTGVTDTYYVGPDLNNDGNLSKANPDGSLVNLETGIRPYKVYSALLTQTGSSAPDATILENTIGNITWSYNFTGNYSANLIGAFPLNKTSCFIQNFATGGGTSVVFELSAPDSIIIITFDASGFNGDNRLNYSPIEIRIYN